MTLPEDVSLRNVGPLFLIGAKIGLKFKWQVFNLLGALSRLFSARVVTFVLAGVINVTPHGSNEVTFVLQFCDKQQMRFHGKADIVRSLL